MKKFLVLFITLISLTSFSQDKLKYSNWVNDFADILTTEQEDKLNKKIADFEKQTDIEFAIVTVKSLDGRSIEGFTHDLASRWGVGKKGKDNGLMILIAPNERKWRIEVGYGLEEYITDGYSKVEAEDVFPDNFRKGDYYAGIDPLVTTFQKRLGTMTWTQRQAEIAKKKQEAEEAKEAFLNVLMWIGIGILGIIVIAIIRKIYLYRKEREEERQRILNKVKRNIEEQVNNFGFYLLQLKKVDPNHKNIKDWEELHKRLLEIYTNSKKLNNYDDVSSMLSESIDISSYEKEMMKGILTKHRDFKTIKEYVSNNSMEKSINRLMASIKDFEQENQKGEYSISWSADNILKDIGFARVCMDVLKVNLSIDKIKVLRDNHDRCETSIEKAGNKLADYRSQLNELYSSKKRINDGLKEIPSLIEKMDKKCKDSDVSSSTKNRAKKVKENFKEYKPTFKQNGVISSWVELSKIITEIKNVTKKAQSDIDDEERKRRNRRRAASSAAIGYGSSSSSWSSSSSGGGFGSFGGGSFGGGGSSGGW